MIFNVIFGSCKWSSSYNNPNDGAAMNKRIIVGIIVQIISILE